jgi:hypothetical protein
MLTTIHIIPQEEIINVTAFLFKESTCKVRKASYINIKRVYHIINEELQLNLRFPINYF